MSKRGTSASGSAGAGRRSRSPERSSSSQPLTDKARGNRRRANEAAGQMGDIVRERRERATRTLQAARPATNTATLAGGSSAQRAAQASLNGMGISARQTAAALRGVPAQFTDIVTSIAGGQQPLTVFLQQGGQLKDMFGGAGAAARALAGYVAGLVNPFTVAAAAAVGVGLAFNAGAAEQATFQRNLIQIGRAHV